LVEDDESVRKLSQMLLESQGYKVVTAVDGQDALKQLPPLLDRLVLVITDVVMPHLDGPQLVEKLRERYPRLKVLYVSGYAGDALVHHGLGCGESAFMQKPFSPLALGHKVRELLDDSSLT
jgi:CheY-like chemotaxis protein